MSGRPSSGRDSTRGRSSEKTGFDDQKLRESTVPTVPTVPGRSAQSGPRSTAEALLAKLDALGVSTRIARGTVAVSPRGKLSEELLSELRAHRDALVAAIAEEERDAACVNFCWHSETSCLVTIHLDSPSDDLTDFVLDLFDGEPVPEEEWDRQGGLQ